MIFLGAITSFSLPPFNYLLINFLSFTSFFIFLIKRSNTNKNNKLFFFYGWLFGFGYFISNLYWISISLSFDQNFTGDFNLKKDLLKKDDKKNFIYTGCQILNKNLFKNYKIKNFSISEIWSELLKKNELNGFESLNKFYHLNNLETFKKLKDS